MSEHFCDIEHKNAICIKLISVLNRARRETGICFQHLYQMALPFVKAPVLRCANSACTTERQDFAAGPRLLGPGLFGTYSFRSKLRMLSRGTT
jgi:hypothetical protein